MCVWMIRACSSFFLFSFFSFFPLPPVSSGTTDMVKLCDNSLEILVFKSQQPAANGNLVLKTLYPIFISLLLTCLLLQDLYVKVTKRL